jgi:hypothetical protein
MLPVTVEESKAQRLQRQQARFRDRGGSVPRTYIELTLIALFSAFVPSEKNALKDILLARTVSGESPSKVVTKSPYRHRSRSASPSKAKRNKATSKAKRSPIKDRLSCFKPNTEAPVGLVSGNAAAGAYYYSTRATSPVDHCVGPSIESGGKVSKAQTKKKTGPTTRKGKGKAKAIDG